MNKFDKMWDELKQLNKSHSKKKRKRKITKTIDPIFSRRKYNRLKKERNYD